MPIIPEIQERLRNAFPETTDIALSRAFKEGLLLADDFYKEGMPFRCPQGQDVRGHVRRVCIGVKVREYCTRGDLPFNVEMVRMPHGGWHWLEIKASGALAHACRTLDVFKFPEEAESRQDYRLSIQPNLLNWFTRDKSITQILREIPEIYAWLTYRANGDGTLAHLCWCSPSPENDDWLAHVNVLREIEEKGGAIVPIVSSVEAPRPRLRDEILQALEEIPLNDNDPKNK